MWHAVADPPFLRLLYIQYKFFSKFTILVIISFHRKSFLSRNLITFLSGGEQQRSFTAARFFECVCLFRFASLTNKIDCRGNILNKISNCQISVKDIPSQAKLSYYWWCSDQNHGNIFILQTFPAVGTDEDECPLRGRSLGRNGWWILHYLMYPARWWPVEFSLSHPESQTCVSDRPLVELHSDLFLQLIIGWENIDINLFHNRFQNIPSFH